MKMKISSMVCLIAFVVNLFYCTAFAASTIAEGFESASGWLLSLDPYWANGGTVSLSYSTEIVNSGTYSMKLDYDFPFNNANPSKSLFSIPSTNYTQGGLLVNCDTSKICDHLEAWIYGDGKLATVSMSLYTQDGSRMCEYQMKDTFSGSVKYIDWTGWKKVKFYPADEAYKFYYSNFRIYQFNLLEIQQNGAHNGVVYIDDIAPGYITEDEIETPEEIVENDLFVSTVDEFSTTGNWVAVKDEYGNNGGTFSIVNSGEQAISGNSALKLNYNYAFSDSTRASYVSLASRDYKTGGVTVSCPTGKSIKNFGMWVYGDGKNETIRLMTYKKSTTSFLTNLTMKDPETDEDIDINWNGWKYVNFSSNEQAYKNISYDIGIYSLILYSQPKYGDRSGSIYFDDLQVTYNDKTELTDISATSLGATTVNSPTLNNKKSIKLEYFQSDNMKSYACQTEVILDSTVKGFGVYGCTSNDDCDISLLYSDSMGTSYESEVDTVNSIEWQMAEFQFETDVIYPITIKAINLYGNKECSVYLNSFYKLYKISQEVYCESADICGVNPTNNIYLSFKVPVQNNSFSNETLSITCDNGSFSDFKVKRINNYDYKIKLLEPLEYSKEYTFTINESVVDIYGDSCKAEITFTTSDCGIEDISFSGDNEAGEYLISGTLEGLRDEVLIVAAVYEVTDNGYMMKGMSPVSVLLGEQFNVAINASPLTNNGKYQAYVFLWDSAQSRCALTTPIILE